MKCTNCKCDEHPTKKYRLHRVKKKKESWTDGQKDGRRKPRHDIRSVSFQPVELKNQFFFSTA